MTIRSYPETIDMKEFPIPPSAETFDEKNHILANTLQRLSAIHKVALTTNSDMELDTVFHNLLQITTKTLNSEDGYILLHDAEKEIFHIHSLLETFGKQLRYRETPCTPENISARVFKTRKPVMIGKAGDITLSGKRSFPGHGRKGLICVPILVRDEIMGTMSVANKIDDIPYTFQDMELLTTIASHAGIAIKNARLNEEQRTVCINIVHSLVSAIDASDSYTRGHSERVTAYSTELAAKVQLPRERIEVIERAAMLHDIGKIGIPASLLNKNTPLTTVEIHEIRQHPLTGMKILEPLDFFREVRLCIGQHHERVDGRGYPHGLKAAEIMLEARILSIADAFDAMTSDRPYRKALSCRDAVRELLAHAGRQHDRKLVHHFVELVTAGTFVIPHPQVIQPAISCSP